ncbi:tRNA pseudouridine synthase [Panus rudis PR-1116 ss-1]|nr:tRNA pseudouridine synthase [Panus rudis PR-1116 ss-1]
MTGGHSVRILNRIRAMAPIPTSYESWSREDLIARLKQLDNQLKQSRQAGSSKSQKSKNGAPLDFSAHPKRKIALKFCYSGQQYSGLEYQFGPTPLPTVESVLFSALVHTKLVDPDGGLEGCGWERCGRTDRGVSAAQQVVSLWVRSAIGESNSSRKQPEHIEESQVVSNTTAQDPSIGEDAGPGLEGDFGAMGDWDEEPTNNTLPSDKEPTELRYVSSLNHVLPPSIRVLAWSPVSSEFSARFNCRHRHYKYFFLGDGLDIEAMRDGARRLEGEHDFRNMCKMDPRKQLSHFTRKIKSATISPVSFAATGLPDNSQSNSNLYVFDLVGTAFLYNQVRHIVALLFLIGSHLEQPSIINALMNTDPSNPLPPYKADEPSPPLILTKPEYQMADSLPLVLWECAYDEKDVNWRIDDLDDTGTGRSDTVSAMIYDYMHTLYARSLIDTTLQSHFLLAASKHHTPSPRYLPLGAPGTVPIPPGGAFGYPLGGGTYKRGSKYTPVLDRVRMASADEINERWRTGRGRKQWERRLEKRAAYDTAALEEKCELTPQDDVDE